VWPTYLHDSNHTGYNSNFTAFNQTNAGNLTQKWTFKTGGNVVDNPAETTITNMAGGCSGAAVPVVFAGSWNGYLYAFNATTGAVCWKTFLAKDTNPNPNTLCITSWGITSSPTVANVAISGTSGQIVYAGASDIMFAVDATTGKIAWKSVLAGADVGTFSPAAIWSSPAYSAGNNAVYIGTASFCDEVQPITGTVYALNPTTGAVTASTAMLPNSAPGGGVWGSPTVGSNNTVYVTTGNAYVNGKQACDAAQPHSCALVALNASTLAVTSSWQVPSSQFAPDGDFGTTPTLFPGPSGATWVGVGNKNGRFYVLDANNLPGGLKWSSKLANGGGNPVKGIIAPSAFFPGSLTNGAVSCSNGVLFIAAGATTLNGAAVLGSVSALCARTGRILWRQATAQIWASPSLANGLLANQSGPNLQVRNWSTGALLKNLATAHNIQGAPTFANGMLYTGSTDHSVYAFGL
jgi:outer membrane protein assembly factor BamB